MTDTAGIIDEIRAALEKVQHSEWFMSPWHVEEDASAVRNSNDFSFIANTSSDSFAAFIATVNPLAIRALLDHVAAQAEEVERVSDLLTAAVDDYNGTLARARELEGALKDCLRHLRENFGDDSSTWVEASRAILTGEQQ